MRRTSNVIGIAPCPKDGLPLCSFIVNKGFKRAKGFRDIEKGVAVIGRIDEEHNQVYTAA